MEITLGELLQSRDARAEKQREMLALYKSPLVSFTMNIPGPEKTSRVIERAFDLGVSLICESICSSDIISEHKKYDKCGPVLILSVCENPHKLKQLFTKIEEEHSLGRLFDIDVIAADGTHLTRGVERGCILCGAPGRVCAAGRLHSAFELASKTNKIMSDFFSHYDADRIALLARDSLVKEVYTTPKPGLVDSENNGSHPDMCLRDFELSADAAVPYFRECFFAGIASVENGKSPLFPALRELGLEAEKEMYRVTGGKNTHKGAIFSYGIIIGALARLMGLSGRVPEIPDILFEARSISLRYLENDIDNFSGNTAGEKAYLERGAKGIRGEVIDGFPTLRDIAIPTYRSAISAGKNKNDAGVLTLLHLIEGIYDTCLYKRGGEEGVRYAREYAKSLISKKDVTLDDVRRMDADFIEKNLSPGGSADLLALTYFLSELSEISP